MEEKILEAIYSWGDFSFVRSSGPGGQNVNKVNSAVLLRLPLEKMQLFSPEDLERLYDRLGKRINEAKELIIQVQDSRSQYHNRDIAVRRAVSLLSRALTKAPLRKASRPTKASREKRLRLKAEKAQLKQTRQRPLDY